MTARRHPTRAPVVARWAALTLLLACAPPPVELSTRMLRLQTHASKLWFAGAANNWPLAGFYVKELGETCREIREARVVHDGHNVAELLTTTLEPELKAVLTTIIEADRPGFEASYDRMIGQCNACHAATGHPYLQLQRPTAPEWTGQRFDPALGVAPAPHDENSPMDDD